MDATGEPGPGSRPGGDSLRGVRALVARLEPGGHVLVMLGNAPVDEGLLGAFREAAAERGYAFAALDSMWSHLQSHLGEPPSAPEGPSWDAPRNWPGNAPVVAAVRRLAAACAGEVAGGEPRWAGLLVVGAATPDPEPCVALDEALRTLAELGSVRAVCLWTAEADGLATEEDFVSLALAHGELYIPHGPEAGGRSLVTRLACGPSSQAPAERGRACPPAVCQPGSEAPAAQGPAGPEEGAHRAGISPAPGGGVSPARRG